MQPIMVWKSGFISQKQVCVVGITHTVAKQAENVHCNDKAAEKVPLTGLLRLEAEITPCSRSNAESLLGEGVENKRLLEVRT